MRNAFMLTLLMSTTAAVAQSDFSAQVFTERADLPPQVSMQGRVWVPADVARVRGVMLFLPGAGLDDRNATTNPAWQKVAQSYGFAVVGVRSIQDFWARDAINTQSSLANILNAAASAAGRAEIAQAPVAVTGFSEGGFNAAYLAAHVPSRVIASVAQKSAGTIRVLSEPPFELSSAARNVPLLLVGGENDPNQSARLVREGFDRWRTAGGNAAYAVAWKTNHSNWPWTINDYDLGMYFLARNIESRLPSTGGALIAPDPSTRWLGEPINFAVQGGAMRPVPNPWVHVAPVASYPNNASVASILPDHATALAYRAMTSSDGVNYGSPTQSPVRVDFAGFFEEQRLDWYATDPSSAFGITVSLRTLHASNVASLDLFINSTLVASLAGNRTWFTADLLAPSPAGLHSVVAIAQLSDGRQLSGFNTFIVRAIPEPALLAVLGSIALTRRPRKENDR